MVTPTPEQITAAAAARARKREAAEAATKKADRDALRKPAPPDMEVRKGTTPTLHQMNEQAKAVDKANKDAAREAAVASARAVQEVLSGPSAKTKNIAKRMAGAGDEGQVVPPGMKEAKVVKATQGGKKAGRRAAPAAKA